MIPRPKAFTDAESEAYTRYLTSDWGHKTIPKIIAELLQKKAEAVEAVAQKWLREPWK